MNCYSDTTLAQQCVSWGVCYGYSGSEPLTGLPMTAWPTVGDAGWRGLLPRRWAPLGSPEYLAGFPRWGLGCGRVPATWRASSTCRAVTGPSHSSRRKASAVLSVADAYSLRVGGAAVEGSDGRQRPDAAQGRWRMVVVCPHIRSHSMRAAATSRSMVRPSPASKPKRPSKSRPFVCRTRQQDRPIPDPPSFRRRSPSPSVLRKAPLPHLSITTRSRRRQPVPEYTFIREEWRQVAMVQVAGTMVGIGTTDNIVLATTRALVYIGYQPIRTATPIHSAMGEP